MGSHTIFFQTGPFRRWMLSIDETGGTVLVQLETAPVDGTPHGLRGTLAFGPDTDGYAEAERALHGSVPEMEAALAWILDATAAKLAHRPPLGEQRRWAHWGRIVAEGQAARATYTPEADHPFRVIGALVVDAR